MERVAPGSVALPGVGIVNAAQLLVTAGENIERLSSEAAFARLCGAAPLEASSGRTQRHRLNPGGDRQANSALYRIVLVGLRYCARIRAYTAKRTAEGKSKREIIRCLKRYVARQLYKTLPISPQVGPWDEFGTVVTNLGALRVPRDSSGTVLRWP